MCIFTCNVLNNVITNVIYLKYKLNNVLLHILCYNSNTFKTLQDTSQRKDIIKQYKNTNIQLFNNKNHSIKLVKAIKKQMSFNRIQLVNIPLFRRRTTENPHAILCSFCFVLFVCFYIMPEVKIFHSRGWRLQKNHIFTAWSVEGCCHSQIAG